MLHQAEEKLMAWVISFGVTLTTVFILSGSVTDPVNTPKFFTLGAVSFLAFGILVSGDLKRVIQSSSAIWISSTLFLIASANSIIFSDSPVTQGIYGSYGRNNGLLTYLFLAMLMLAVSSLTKLSSFQRIVKSLLWAGLVNLTYCTWVIFFGDFIGWNNPYGNVLGTFGNPNFVGAFLGIFFAAYLAFGLSKSASKTFFYSLFLILPLTAFVIYESKAIQGRVVGLGGTAIVLFFFLKSRVSAFVLWVFSFSVGVLGIFATLGALQIGPLSDLIYKTSVSLRGQYWLAGWNTGRSNPISGVGMDSFGDWYRRSRDVHALDMPGVNTVVNAAHNVPLDMFAFGGWPLFITYLVIMIIGFISIVRTGIRVKTYDPIFTTLVIVWVGYQIQSLISINQIGLAIWGWVINGAVIAYERATRLTNVGENQTASNKVQRNRNTSLAFKTIASMTALGMTALVVALPPIIADSKWRSAQKSGTVEALENSMLASYFNPHNSMKFSINIQTLEQNGLHQLARKYALMAVDWNPEAFELWRALYFIKESTGDEKDIALSNMKRLDPLNPDVTNIS